MTITQISYQNLKGRTEDVALGKATLIYGPNFAGKTTIIDAIKLALLGFHPQLDKTGRGTMELASGDELSVSAHITDGAKTFAIGRKWNRSGDKVAKKDFVPMNWPETPVVLLDANAYFGASDRGKAELLFGAAQIKGTLTSKQISEHLGEAFGVSSSWQCGSTTQAYIENVLQSVEHDRSEAAASVRRYADTMQGLSALRDVEPVPVDEDAAKKLTAKRREFENKATTLAQARLKATADEAAKDDKLEDAKRRVRTLSEFIAQKDVEIGKLIKRWDALLSHHSCPMCGTEGKVWREGALITRKNEHEELEREKFALKTERNAKQHYVQTEEKLVQEERKKLAKANKRRIDNLEEDLAGLREEMAALLTQTQKAADDARDRKRLKEAGDKHYEYVEREAKLKAAKKYLLETKAAMASDLFGPILKTASVFTEGIFRTPLVFRDGELGRSTGASHLIMSPPRDDHFIPHRTFSGTESAIAFAAFQAALGATAPLKLVIMDELGRLDGDNKVQLFNNIEKALDAGIIDQFIGIDTERPDFTTRGFTLIERGGTK